MAIAPKRGTHRPQTKDDPPHGHPSPGRPCSQENFNHIEAHHVSFEAYLILNLEAYLIVFVHICALKMLRTVKID